MPRLSNPYKRRYEEVWNRTVGDGAANVLMVAIYAAV